MSDEETTAPAPKKAAKNKAAPAAPVAAPSKAARRASLVKAREAEASKQRAALKQTGPVLLTQHPRAIEPSPVTLEHVDGMVRPLHHRYRS